jgi:FtsP/CotA-like multicopper oxidase with cupredoxin domain
LPWKVVDGVKVYHLIAEEVDHEFAPGLRARCWGYNGRVHGPTIEAVEGDRVRVYVTNKLAAPTTVHWHGIFLPNGMDGVGGLNQRTIAPGETFRYEWTFKQSRHLHVSLAPRRDDADGAGHDGHDRRPPAPSARGYRVDRDFVIMLSEWKIVPAPSGPTPTR